MGFFGDLRNALKNAEPVERVAEIHGEIDRLYCTSNRPNREAKYHEDSCLLGPVTEHTGEVVSLYRCTNCGCEWLASEE